MDNGQKELLKAGSCCQPALNKSMKIDDVKNGLIARQI